MILILDNYDSFTYNLVDIVAMTGQPFHVRRNDKITLDEVAERQPSGILISPGPGRPEDAGISQSVIEAFGPRIPILGVCLGHQAIGQVYGGKVVHAPSLMHGKTSMVHHPGEGIYSGLPSPFQATRYHSLVVAREGLPDDLEITSTTPDGIIMGLRHRVHPVEGVQFHPESILTTEGPRLVTQWVRSTARPSTEPAPKPETAA